MGTVGRVFAAVPLPVEVRMAIEERTAPLDIPGRRVPPQDWHLTLRFLGVVDDVTYDRFLHALRPVEEMPAFRVGLGELGAFPNPRRATVVWLGVDQGEEGLARLNEIAEDAAQMAGLPAEERPFRPHLTLARVRPPASIGHLPETRVEVGWKVDEVVVFLSHPSSGEVRYEPLDSIGLSR